jgi:hypothetical protein
MTEQITGSASYEAWHTKGGNPCGGLAWTFIRHPSITMGSSNVAMPDGARPRPLSEIACGSCGKFPRAVTAKGALELRQVAKASK